MSIVIASKFDGDCSATVYNVFGVFGVKCVLLNSGGCVICETGVVDGCLDQCGGMCCRVRIFCCAND